MISIIVPTYNRLQVLKRCVESILPEYYQGLELIVIDDCSNDGSREYLAGLASKNPFLKVGYNKKNFGVNYARNRGIEMVSNSYTMFIDSDDKVIPGSIGKIRSALNNSPGRKHYLFLLSYRLKEFQTIKEPKEVFYNEWIKGSLAGDFTHVVSTDILRQFMFFEQFRMFEQLNWYRIYKATSPQLLIPIPVADIELGRTDSLSVNQKLKSVLEIEAKFQSEKFFYELFYEDLKRFNPGYLRSPLIKSLFLGVAVNKKEDSKKLIRFADDIYVKLIGTLLLFFPPKVALFGITGFSNVKRKLLNSSGGNR